MEEGMQNAHSVIDLPVIDELFEFDLQNDDDLLPELFEIFRETAPKHVHEIEIAFEKNDWKAMFHNAHTLKSSSGNLGAKVVMQLCKAIEEATRTKDPDSVAPLVGQIQLQLKFAIQELTTLLGEKYAKVA
jgi:HPt (histidine-containing phosphotransfer) domain-containing protein